MELQGPGASGMSGASLELASLKLAKNQQQQDGAATLQLLESAAGVPATASSDSALGSRIDTYA